MFRRFELWRAAGCASLVLLCAGPAWAQSQSSIAEALYQEGRELLTAGKAAEACPKFAESYRLEAGAGTLLNLAACNEQLGKTATAWSQFSEAYAVLSRQGDNERAEYAADHRDALAKKLPKLAIEVPESSRVSQLVVTLDGVAVGSAVWGVGVPIDPGPHTVTARAPGYVDWSGKVEIASGAETKKLLVPTLKRGAQPASAQPVSTSSGSAPEADSGGRPLTAPVVILGIATIGLGVGAGVTGALYMQKRGEYDEANGQPGSDPVDVNKLHNDADTLGNLNLGLTIGAVATGVTTLIWYLATPKEPANTAFAPWVDPHAAGATFQGQF